MSTADEEGFKESLRALEFAPMDGRVVAMVKDRARTFNLVADVNFADGRLDVQTRPLRAAEPKSLFIPYRATAHGIEIVDLFPKDAEYRSAVESLQKQYGPKLGLFLANRFAKLIRDRHAECISHVRVCVVGDVKQEAEFTRIRDSGCCGSVEAEFSFDDRVYRIGFNYGH